jgi:glycosyltransferase involved in cell wall biosynthesis
MRIGIDIRVLSRGTRTGVEEYTLNLLFNVLSLNQEDEYFLFYNAYRKVSLDYSWLKSNRINLKQFKIPNRFFFASARYFHFPKIDKLLGGVGVFLNPHFFVAPVSKQCSKITTFHDLSFERHPEFFSFKKRNWHNLLMSPKREAKDSELILAVSESTKEDLIDLYGIKSEKIKVVYPGVDVYSFEDNGLSMSQNFLKIKRKYSLPDNFILYFGTIEPRKNIKGLIKSFEKLNANFKKNQGYKLVIAGVKGWLHKEIFKTAKNSRFSQDIIFVGYIEEQDKPYLYSLARLFVYPSFFEGFGFPPLEAMAYNTPVIVSNSSSLPEVVGDAALMVNPYNIDEIEWAMREVLENNQLRQVLIRKGQEQVKKFSWQKSAEQVLKIIKKS